jgi:hypothetical protein
MTSVTYGMRKSLCKVMFDMYQGALANFLNVLERNVTYIIGSYCGSLPWEPPTGCQIANEVTVTQIGIEATTR